VFSPQGQPGDNGPQPQCQGQNRYAYWRRNIFEVKNVWSLISTLPSWLFAPVVFWHCLYVYNQTKNKLEGMRKERLESLFNVRSLPERLYRSPKVPEDSTLKPGASRIPSKLYVVRECWVSTGTPLSLPTDTSDSTQRSHSRQCVQPLIREFFILIHTVLDRAASLPHQIWMSTSLFSLLVAEATPNLPLFAGLTPRLLRSL